MGLETTELRDGMDRRDFGTSKYISLSYILQSATNAEGLDLPHETRAIIRTRITSVPHSVQQHDNRVVCSQLVDPQSPATA